MHARFRLIVEPFVPSNIPNAAQVRSVMANIGMVGALQPESFSITSRDAPVGEKAPKSTWIHTTI